MTLVKPIEKDNAEAVSEPTGANDVLYARCDDRGVIQASNCALEAVTGLDRGSLIGSPYRNLFDGAISNAVIWKMSQAIHANIPFVSYVNIRSSTNGWSWVLMAVFPNPDGYLVISTKPNSAAFKSFREIYAQLETQEKQAAAPKQIAHDVANALESQTGIDFDRFMASALEQELEARDKILGQEAGPTTELLCSVGALLGTTLHEQNDLLGEFEALQSIPNNMRIIASRLEPSGGPISAISDNYKYSSAEISQLLDSFTLGDQNLCALMVRKIEESLVSTGCVRLLSETRRALRNERQTDTSRSMATEINAINRVEKLLSASARSAIFQTQPAADALYQACFEIRRMMLGLDTIRVMGRVESGRLGSSGIGLAATIDQLDVRHGEISEKLQKLMELSVKINDDVSNAFE